MTVHTIERNAVSNQTDTKERCSDCGAVNLGRNSLTYDGKVFCEACYYDKVGVCHHCHNSSLRESLYLIDSREYCGTCLDQLFHGCEGCERFVKVEDINYSEVHCRYYCDNCFHEHVDHCISCDEQIDAQTANANDSGERYCDSCWDGRDEDSQGPEYTEFSGTSFFECTSKRKYGAEIEALLDEGMDHLPLDRAGSWRQVQDGSLGDDGREHVSPILQGDEGFYEIRRFTAVLKDWGYFVRRSCGLHVHIDGRDLDSSDVKRLLKLTRFYEPVLYAMLPESRRTGAYSVPLAKFPKSRFRIAACGEAQLKKLWYGSRSQSVDTKSKYHHSRYYGLNLHSWFFRRSLEFRYHSGTLNPMKITNFITICQAMVDKAKEIKRLRANDRFTLGERFESFVPFLGLSSEIVSYMRHRMNTFHPDCLEVKPV